jgi:hypothetical protein
VVAPAVDDMPLEDEELSLEDEELSLEDEVEDESSLDVVVAVVVASSFVVVAYGSLAVVAVVVDVVLVAVPADAGETLASAGSSPSWTRSASTPKTATKLAVAPAANFRRLGPRRTRLLFSSGMTTGSTAALNPS